MNRDSHNRDLLISLLVARHKCKDRQINDLFDQVLRFSGLNLVEYGDEVNIISDSLDHWLRFDLRELSVKTDSYETHPTISYNNETLATLMQLRTRLRELNVFDNADLIREFVEQYTGRKIVDRPDGTSELIIDFHASLN